MKLVVDFADTDCELYLYLIVYLSVFYEIFDIIIVRLYIHMKYNINLLRPTERYCFDRERRSP